MKLFLIRHGESEANLHSYYAGQADMALTDAGRKQAESIRPVLQAYCFDKVYASDLQRASCTCELALPGVSYEKLTVLREYDVGSLTGAPLGSVKRDITADPQYRPDYREFGGENAEMVCARAKSFLQMLETEAGEYVVAFSHYGFINCVIRTILGVAYDGSRICTDNCSIHVMEHDGKSWKILALNLGIEV